MRNLTRTQITEKLCYYDKRNPYGHHIFSDEELQRPEKCSCDNCFYGRTKLAEELLNLLEEIDKLTKVN